MSLNNIHINPQLLARLYPHTLLERRAGIAFPAEAPPVEEPLLAASRLPEEKPAANLLPYSGGNQKNITVVVAQAKAGFLPGKEAQFLSAVLAACRLSMADVAVVNLHHHPATYQQLAESLRSRQMLLFGVEPQQLDLPLNFPHFQLQPFHGCTYLAAPPLAQIEQDKGLKSKLWACLKSLFDL